MYMLNERVLSNIFILKNEVLGEIINLTSINILLVYL